MNRFSRSEVRGQGHSEAKYTSGFEIPIDLDPTVRCVGR